MSSATAAPVFPERVSFRGASEGFNRLYVVVLREGKLWFKRNPDFAPAAVIDTWQELPTPEALRGRIKSMSMDDINIIAIHDNGAIYTFDGALLEDTAELAKVDAHWTTNWGVPFWKGGGRAMPADAQAWALSFLSPDEDHHLTDPKGQEIWPGLGVTSIYALRDSGARLTLIDPWLPNDDNYEACLPEQGRVRGRAISASGSTMLLVSASGKLYARTWDFDISGADDAFFCYSYEPAEWGKLCLRFPHPRNRVRPMPPEDWRELVLPAGARVVTDRVAIFKTGQGGARRIRVEGQSATGDLGYFEKDLGADGWRFAKTGEALKGTSLATLSAANADVQRSTLRFVGRKTSWIGAKYTIEIPSFDWVCGPATLRLIADDGNAVPFTLHFAQGIRVSTWAGVGLRPDVGLPMVATLEVSEAARAQAAAGSALLRKAFADFVGTERFISIGLDVRSGGMTFKRPGANIELTAQ